MKVVYKTDKGVVRSSNQDWVEVRNFGDSSFLVVICDGIGGTAGGEIASKNAAVEICNYFENSTKKDINTVLESIKFANEKILNIGKLDSSISDLGTTSVVAFAKDDNLYVANVGDSRAYIVSKPEIIQITKDHSVVNELVMQGRMTSSEAENAPNKNIITRALGCANSNPDYYERKLEQGQKVLLCTDGLTNCVSDDKIKQIINENTPDDASKKLIDEANRNGGTDNITLAIIFD